MRVFQILLTMTAAVCLTASSASAGQKKLMHCFAFTSIPEATNADWQAFFRATDQLPSKIKSISHVWYGKLARPLKQGDVTRDWGVCMEMADEAALTAYDKDPAHTAWVAVYEKVRKEGTTTFNIIGQ